MKKFFTFLFSLVIISLLSYFAVRPLFINGFFPMHDDTQPSRVYVMAKALSAGQFPVRWVSDLGYGYGYPLFNFYAPLPYYIGAAFYLLGFPVISATKIMIGLGMILASFFMYLAARKVTDDFGATLSAILYMFAPYHAVQVYVRGAVGELYAYAFLPLLFWGVLHVFQNNSKKDVKTGIVVGSVGLSLILLSHNVIGMVVVYIFLISLTIYIIQIIRLRKPLLPLKALCVMFVIAGTISSFFTLPALIESKFTSVDTLIRGGSDFHDHFVFPLQLWDSPWGFGGSAKGVLDGMSFRIGKIHVFVGLVALLLIRFLTKKQSLKPFPLTLYRIQLAILGTSIFMMLPISVILWEKLPGFSYIQYPWRLLTFTAFSISVLGGILTKATTNNIKKSIIAVTVIGGILLLNLKLFDVKYIKDAVESEYISSEALRFTISKISDEYLPKEFIRPTTQKETVNGILSESDSLHIEQKIESVTRNNYTLQSNADQVIVANLAFFPGWNVFVDSRETEVRNYSGKIAFEIPQGTHTVKLIFENTQIRTVANAISLFGIFLLGYVSFGAPGIWGGFSFFKTKKKKY